MSKNEKTALYVVIALVILGAIIYFKKRPNNLAQNLGTGTDLSQGGGLSYGGGMGSYTLAPHWQTVNNTATSTTASGTAIQTKTQAPNIIKAGLQVFSTAITPPQPKPVVKNPNSLASQFLMQ